MIHLTVSDEYARLIAESATPVIVVDPAGYAIGQIAPVDPQAASQPFISAEDLAELERRKANDDGTRYTTAEVLQYLRTLAPE